jgi:hypothetical protein
MTLRPCMKRLIRAAKEWMHFLSSSPPFIEKGLDL